MIETILSFFSEYYPQLGIALIVGFIAWRLSKYHSSIEETKKKVDNLPCEKNGKDLLDLKGMKDTVVSTNDAVIEISNWIMRRDSKMIGAFAKKHSPMVLVPAGEELLEVSCGKNTIDNNLDFFINLIDECNPQIAYDVEETAYKVIFKNTANSIFNCIKDYIYYSPEEIELNGEMKKISLSSIIFVMSIYLRDKYLEIHPEIEKRFELINQ
jgi:hypothetical protein